MKNKKVLLSYTEGQVDESQSNENRKVKYLLVTNFIGLSCLFSATAQVVGRKQFLC